MAGPFPSLAAACRDARGKAEDPARACVEESRPPGFDPPIDLPPSVLAFEYRELADPGRGALMEVTCVAALKTSAGWFHHLWHCESELDGGHSSMFERARAADLVHTGAPELVLEVSESRQVGEDGDEQWLVQLVCDASDPAHPWCLGPVHVATERYGSRRMSWSLIMLPTADGFTLERRAGSIPDPVGERLGAYIVEPSM